jgi:hypothetical protein
MRCTAPATCLARATRFWHDRLTRFRTTPLLQGRATSTHRPASRRNRCRRTTRRRERGPLNRDADRVVAYRSADAAQGSRGTLLRGREHDSEHHGRATPPPSRFVRVVCTANHGVGSAAAGRDVVALSTNWGSLSARQITARRRQCWLCDSVMTWAPVCAACAAWSPLLRPPGGDTRSSRCWREPPGRMASGRRHCTRRPAPVATRRSVRAP